ncbi:hypothetical protein ACFX10_011714 [Malus domestica]
MFYRPSSSPMLLGLSLPTCCQERWLLHPTDELLGSLGLLEQVLFSASRLWIAALLFLHNLGFCQSYLSCFLLRQQLFMKVYVL